MSVSVALFVSVSVSVFLVWLISTPLTLPQGDACTASVPCFDPVYNVTCRRGMCVYHNFLVAGEACNLNDPSFFNGGCADSLTCTNGVCGPSVAVGAQCMTGAWSCAAGAYCNPTLGGRSGAQRQGVCAAFVATGGACNENFQCAPGNVCLQQVRFNIRIDTQIHKYTQLYAHIAHSI